MKKIREISNLMTNGVILSLISIIVMIVALVVAFVFGTFVSEVVICTWIVVMMIFAGIQVIVKNMGK
mgnify:CR=1 FL=1